MKANDNNNPLDLEPHPLDRDIEKKKGREALGKVSFAFLFLVLVLLTALYFTLPAFQVRGIRYSGLHYLTKEDVETLSGKAGRESLLFVDEKDFESMSDTICTKGDGLVLELSYHGNMFSLSCDVIEASPVLSFEVDGKPVVYLSSGETLGSFTAAFSGQGLAQGRKETILSEMAKESKDIPVAHFQTGFSGGESFLSKRGNLLSCPFLDREVLQFLHDVVFLDYHDGLFERLDLVLGKDGEYLIEGVPFQEKDFFDPDFLSRLYEDLTTFAQDQDLGKDGADNGLTGEYYRFEYLRREGKTYSLSPAGQEGEAFQVGE